MNESFSESNSVVSYGQMSGINVGGVGNWAVGGASTMEQQPRLVAELQALLEELIREARSDEQRQDIAKVSEAVSHAKNGKLDAVKQSLSGVGGWVSEVARRVGATLLTKLLEGDLS